MVFLEVLLAACIPILGSMFYVGRVIGEVKTGIAGIKEDLAPLQKLPERMVAVETRLRLVKRGYR